MPRSAAATQRHASRREAAAEERRQAILDAALQEFADRGFAAARLEDVARRAGVAKGTIYLLCKDKEDLLKQVVRAALTPIIDRLVTPPDNLPPTPEFFRELMNMFVSEVLHTDRRLVAQIMIKEAGRFPEIAAFYHREVVSRILAFAAGAAARAQDAGELRSEAYARSPQLMIAPMLFALVWEANFSAIAPLDVAELLRAHHAAMFAGTEAKDSSK